MHSRLPFLHPANQLVCQVAPHDEGQGILSQTGRVSSHLTLLLRHMKQPERVRRCLTGSWLELAFLRLFCGLVWLYIMGGSA